MLTTIELYDQHGFRAREIHNVRPDSMLATELVAIKPTIA